MSAATDEVAMLVMLGWVLALVLLVLGATWGRSVGRGAALAEAANSVEDEALRAFLHGDDLMARHLSRLAQQLRHQDEPAETRRLAPFPGDLAEPGPAAAGAPAASASAPPR